MSCTGIGSSGSRAPHNNGPGTRPEPSWSQSWIGSGACGRASAWAPLAVTRRLTHLLRNLPWLKTPLLEDCLLVSALFQHHDGDIWLAGLPG